LTIRINSRQTPDGAVIELHGWLNQEALDELQKLCASTIGPYRLNVSQLAGSDQVGLVALRSWIAAGSRVEGASPYIQLLLDESRT
jgi:hypothetical protein